MTTDKIYMLRLETGFGDEFYFFHSKVKAKQRLWEYYEAHCGNEPENMRKAAKDTIFNMWNHINASNRLYEMLISIYNHKDFAKFDSGPISKIK